MDKPFLAARLAVAGKKGCFHTVSSFYLLVGLGPKLSDKLN